MKQPSLFEPGALDSAGEPDAIASIAISLKRIADVMQGTDKNSRSMNLTLSEIAQHLVHLVAKR